MHGHDFERIRSDKCERFEGVLVIVLGRIFGHSRFPYSNLNGKPSKRAFFHEIAKKKNSPNHFFEHPSVVAQCQRSRRRTLAFSDESEINDYTKIQLQTHEQNEVISQKHRVQFRLFNARCTVSREVASSNTK